ncbi:MAG: threonine-phosphate decarboxylase CobD [Candidatus Bathyarchaeota archaeon]|nr:threonine-phosphate decarboxylase CobD [Candidatus Bathyarchaeota archaeon]
MKSAANLAREEIKQLKPCVHGGEIWNLSGRKVLEKADILDFSSNVNPLGPSPKAIQTIKKSLSLIPYYPDPNATALLDAIACSFKAINRENVIAGNGSVELIYLFADVFMSKDDVALIPVPTFSEYEKAVRKVGARPKLLKLGPSFKVDSSLFIREMRGTKAVFLCNPNNPTGILTPRADIARIIDEALSENVLVFLDEDFIEFVDEEKRFSFVDEIGRYPNLIVLRSFTKFFGLTGLRVGYALADKEVVKVLSAAKAPWNVNCLAQVAAVAALQDVEHMRRSSKLIKKERKFLMEGLSSISVLKVYPTDANFLFIDVRQSGFTAAQLKEKLLKYGVLIRDCTSFVGIDEYYIRVAVKTRRENLKLLETFKKVLEK